MDKDRVKGAVNDAAGRVKRQVGEWTGDTNAQVEGSVQQIKGKTQKAWGAAKDAAREAKDSPHRDHMTTVEREQEREREAEAEREAREHAHSSHHQ
jgi:uncharacterized protein YjbJ (UPF0337 family)